MSDSRGWDLEDAEEFARDGGPRERTCVRCRATSFKATCPMCGALTFNPATTWAATEGDGAARDGAPRGVMVSGDEIPASSRSAPLSDPHLKGLISNVKDALGRYPFSGDVMRPEALAVAADALIAYLESGRGTNDGT